MDLGYYFLVGMVVLKLGNVVGAIGAVHAPELSPRHFQPPDVMDPAFGACFS